MAMAIPAAGWISPTAVKSSQDAAREVQRQWVVLLAGLLLLTALVSTFQLLWRADLALYDAGLPGGKVPDDIVIVEIDDRSLDSLGRWPWSRGLHAALLERLRAAGVAGVALDLIFTEPDETHPEGDRLFAEALRAGPPAVLPFIVQMPIDGRGRIREQLPLPALAASAAGLGHIHLELDRDGIARSVFLREGMGTADRSQLMLELLQVTGRAPTELPGLRRPAGPGDATSWERDYQLLIPFLGPPGQFTRFSYCDVLNGSVAPEALRNRWALVGVTAQGLADAYATPLSGQSTAMPGVEVNANILQALRSGTWIRPMGRVTGTILCCIPVLLAVLGFRWLPPRYSLPWVILLWFGSLGLSETGLRLVHWWWPCSASLATLALAYPLWSWRRLEATQRYLQAQLSRFNADHPPVLTLIRDLPALAGNGDPLQHRIELLQQATDRLREMGQLLSVAIDLAPDATLVLDNEGRIALANAAACSLLNRPWQSLEQQSMDALPELASSLASFDFPRLAMDAPRTVELRLAAQSKDLLVRAVPFVIDGRSRLGTLLAIVDISEMRRSQREREDIIRFLSHDLKSPATSLLGLAQLQRDPSRRLGDQDLSARLDRLAHRLLDLLDGFIALAHAESVDPVEFSECDLLDILQDAQDEVWAVAQARAVDISVSAPESRVRVRGDRQLLARAVTNLLLNAARFSPVDCSIRVSCRKSAESACITVEDDGPGVAPEDRARLFKRFARFGTHEPHSSKGAGLGLAFVAVVAQKHAGSVRYEDPAGGGARFVLELPLSTIADAAAS